MEFLKKEHSLSTKITMGLIIPGFFIALASVLGCINGENNIVGIIIVFLGLVSVIITVLSRFEKNDEMSRLHILKASSDGFGFMMIMIMVLDAVYLLITSLKLPITMRWESLVDIMLGVGILYVGIRFQKYEKEGDLDAKA